MVLPPRRARTNYVAAMANLVTLLISYQVKFRLLVDYQQAHGWS